jgi:hypothetical protein
MIPGQSKQSALEQRAARDKSSGASRQIGEDRGFDSPDDDLRFFLLFVVVKQFKSIFSIGNCMLTLFARMWSEWSEVRRGMEFLH